MFRSWVFILCNVVKPFSSVPQDTMAGTIKNKVADPIQAFECVIFRGETATSSGDTLDCSCCYFLLLWRLNLTFGGLHTQI